MDTVPKTFNLKPETYSKLINLALMKQISVKKMGEHILTAGINHRYSLLNVDKIDLSIADRLKKKDKRRRY